MESCHSSNLVLIEELLGHIRERYNILGSYELHALWLGQRSYDPFPNRFGLSIDVLEVGLRHCRRCISSHSAESSIFSFGCNTRPFGSQSLSVATLRFLRSFLHNVCPLIPLPRLVVTSKYVRITPAFDCTAYCLLHSLVEHSCINPKSSTFGYLDEKSIDTGLMKFLGLCHSVLSWYLEFAFAFSTSLAPFYD
ncbi:hypothetical protein BHE74_00013171 [Ensete ventricosum]|nr:hypothetical protein BHE74_00013171 [Ensete ventricosum]